MEFYLGVIIVAFDTVFKAFLMAKCLSAGVMNDSLDFLTFFFEFRIDRNAEIIDRNIFSRYRCWPELILFFFTQQRRCDEDGELCDLPVSSCARAACEIL